MINSAKSGCPVIGQSTVNSGAVKRATYRVSAWGLATRSSVAGSGGAGIRGVFPSFLSFPAIRLGGSHVIAELERAIDHDSALHRVACSANGEVTIVEQAPKNALLDLYALHLVEMHFECVPSDEPLLVQDTTVSHRDFDGEALPPVLDQEHGAGEEGSRDGDPSDEGPARRCPPRRALDQ